MKENVETQGIQRRSNFQKTHISERENKKNWRNLSHTQKKAAYVLSETDTRIFKLKQLIQYKERLFKPMHILI